MEGIQPPDTTIDDQTVEGSGSRLLKGFLFFLEAIGLRRSNSVDSAAQIARLKKYHTEFRKLISSNNSFLETTAELEHKILSRGYIDPTYTMRKVMRTIGDIYAMVESLNVISGNRYSELKEPMERVTEELKRILAEPNIESPTAIVLELPDIRKESSDLTGGKMSNLGEIANTLHLPTPDGFVVTTEGFRMFMEESGIRSWVQDQHMALLLEPGEVTRISEQLKSKIEETAVPPLLAEAIFECYDRLCNRTGSPPAMAVRSSALGEDGEFSYAGQFLSVLNVEREGLPNAYLQVIASLYSPEAIHYQLLHGIFSESIEMAVGFVAMIDPLTSGVVFTRDPNNPESDRILIQAVQGLGIALVDGKTSPESVSISRNEYDKGLVRTLSKQETRFISSTGKGIIEVPVSAEPSVDPFIGDAEAWQLAQWAIQLEAHFGCPQDIEWAVGFDHKISILQSRPLRLISHSFQAHLPVDGYEVLLSGGETACPGAGSGVTVHFGENDDMDSFPVGGILVTKRPSPKFTRLMSKAKAIVTDFGSTTGHMASLAREFRVPTLLNTGTATRDIPVGITITVDAGGGFVYKGAIPLAETIETTACQSTVSESKPTSPRFRLLEKAVEIVAPLNLTDPSTAEFRASGCRSLHDIARYVHEKSYEEMFMMGSNVGDLRTSAFYLDVFLPIDLYLIDLGGGIENTHGNRKVKRSQVTSTPLSALLKGMLHKKIPRYGAKPIDISGFFSIMMRHAVNNPEGESTFRDPCYAIISDNYLNYAARAGYHFNVVDTYCGKTPNKNYISLTFRGGAADFIRRSRRTRAIAAILREYGFSVHQNHDMVNARLSKANREEISEKLEMIGRLLQFFRQLDAAMVNENSVQLIKEAFLNEDYDLKKMVTTQ